MLRPAPWQQAQSTPFSVQSFHPTSFICPDSFLIALELRAWLRRPCIQPYLHRIRYSAVPHTLLLFSLTLALSAGG